MCGADDAKTIGVRGNREYAGADPTAEPHISTSVVKCRQCGFIYTNPMIRGLEHLERAHYDDPDTYQFAAGSSPTDNVAERLAIIDQHARGHRLLDVGAGKGEFVAGASAAGFDAIGVEPSSRFCEHARRAHGVTMHQGALAGVAALASERFDVVVALHVLEHVDDPHDFVRSLGHHAQFGGLVVIEVPNGASTLLHAADSYHRLRGRRWSTRVSPLHPPFHRVAYTRRSLEHLVQTCGLELVDVCTLSGLGRDVARPPGRGGVEWALRRSAARVVDLFGNREFLFVVARRTAR